MGALAELIKLGIKTASKQVDEVVPKTLSRMRSDYTPSPIVDETTDVLTALGRSEDDIVKFKKENLLEGSEKEVYRNSKLEEQARALDEGLITLDEFKEARDIFKPRRTYGTVPKLYELFDILGSMGKSVKNKGIVGVNKNIKSGELVNTRFDVKAYENYGRYVVTVGKGNKVTGYAPTAILKNVKFAGNPSIEEASKRVPDIGEKSFNLAKGKRIEGGKKLGIKSPFATMEGKWQNMSPESTHKYAEDLMDAGKVNKYGETDKEWTEIGFDPASKSSFYNRSTGEPIFAADKVVQVGSMLLARGIKKPTKQQLKSLQFITKAGKEIEGYKEGGQVLPVIEKNIGGQVLEGLDGEYMRQRNSKEKLEGIMGIPQIQPRQYGGGLDDAYMNRRSAFAAPDANSAFASPMSQGGLPTIYREDGGTTIPKERMINDQPHQLSYINPEEAGLLQALGGSGRRVDGIPSYFWSDDSSEESGYATGGEEGYGADGNYDGPSYSDDGIGYDVPAPAAAPASTPSDGDDQDEEYLTTLFGEGKERADNLKAFGDMNTPQDLGTGGPGNLSQQDYIQRLNKEGFPEWSVPYYNSLKNRGMTNDQATAALAAAMSTPGGLAGMQNAYAGDYSYGGAFGTMQDLLEKGMQSQFNYDDLLSNDKKIKKDATEQDAYEKGGQELSTAELAINGVKGFYDNISNFLSVKSDLDPNTLSNIEARAKEQGLTYTPSSNVLGNIMNFGIGMIPGGNVIKGLASLTGAGKTIGTITNEKTGMSFNLSDTGKISMIEDRTFDAQDTTGSDNDSVDRRPRPVQQKAAASTTEDKPLTDMAGLLAKRDKPVSREASNKYSRDLLDSLGYGNVNIG